MVNSPALRSNTHWQVAQSTAQPKPAKEYFCPNTQIAEITVGNTVLNSLRYYLSCDTYVSQTQCRVSSDTSLRSVRNAFNTRPLPAIRKDKMNLKY